MVRSPQTDPSYDPDGPGLHAAVDLLTEHLAAPRASSPEQATALPRQLPEDGVGGQAALRRLAPTVLGGAADLSHPGFFAHMDPPTPWVTWAAAQWSAALNQNLLHPDTAPTARDLEALVVDWLAPEFGLRGGHLVPGSTVANLTALWAARQLRGLTTVVASQAAHLSVAKAAHLLGMEYRSVPVDDHQRLRPDRLGDLSSAALVVTAGTVASGAVDPLDAGAEAPWRHIDAAWAGPLRLSERHRWLLDGVQHADSLSFSAHKLLWQPKECGAVLFADPGPAHAAVSYSGGYLSVPNVGLLGSHGTPALPLAATLLAWGRTGIQQRIDHCMALADELADRIKAQPELELWDRPITGVVLWRPRGHDPRAVQAHLNGAFVSVTDVDGQTWLRSVAANPGADPSLVIDRVLDVLGHVTRCGDQPDDSVQERAR